MVSFASLSLYSHQTNLVSSMSLLFHILVSLLFNLSHLEDSEMAQYKLFENTQLLQSVIIVLLSYRQRASLMKSSIIYLTESESLTCLEPVSPIKYL